MSSERVQHLRRQVRRTRGSAGAKPMAFLQTLYALRNAQRNNEACARIRRQMSQLDG